MPLYIPAPGMSVPDPERGGLVPPQGREVDPNVQYWAHRIRDRDLILPPEPAPAIAPATVPAAEPAAPADEVTQ